MAGGRLRKQPPAVYKSGKGQKNEWEFVGLQDKKGLSAELVVISVGFACHYFLCNIYVQAHVWCHHCIQGLYTGKGCFRKRMGGGLRTLTDSSAARILEDF